MHTYTIEHFSPVMYHNESLNQSLLLGIFPVDVDADDFFMIFYS